MGVKVGIDLGTTYSAIAYIDPKTEEPCIIKNDRNKPVTPSVLYFEQDGTILFGEEAKEMLSLGDGNGASLFKRKMGNDSYRIVIHGREYTATDLSAILLEKIVNVAQAQIGQKIDSAVITVPAYFTHKEREATIEAGKKAKLNVLSIINEPSSAAFAYGLNKTGIGQTILIYDLGGGTFDVSIAKISSDEIEILATDGNHELGGKDWDDRIALYLSQKFKSKQGVDVTGDPEFSGQLLLLAENAKRQLSELDSTKVRMQYNNTTENIEFTNSAFESISEDLMELTKDLTENVIAAVNLSWSNIDGVILVGGSTRMRMVKTFVKTMSGKEPLSGINVDEIVALGAAVKANTQAQYRIGGSVQKDTPRIGAMKLTDITAHSLGMIAKTPDGSEYINDIIIKKNSKIPTENQRIYEHRSKEMEVYVLQGEFPAPEENTLLYKYAISGIDINSSLPTKIGVTYQYDSNGVVNVIAEQMDGRKALKVKREPIPDDWTTAALRDQKGEHQSIEIVLAVDLSGSMSNDPLKDAKRAMADFTNKFDSNYTKIAVLGFSDRCKTFSQLSSDFSNALAAINSLNIGIKLGFGNAAEPFTDAKSLFANNNPNNAIRYIVCLTDGRWDNVENAINCAKSCHRAGIEVISLGFGYADYNFLKAIASLEDFASFTTSSADLGGSFSKIATVISDRTTGIKVM